MKLGGVMFTGAALYKPTDLLQTPDVLIFLCNEGNRWNGRKKEMEKEVIGK